MNFVDTILCVENDVEKGEILNNSIGLNIWRGKRENNRD
jgi:hypothetical protein